MAKRTTPEQRQSFYVRHIRGETYRAIAESESVSLECVRYWCRRQRDGGSYHSTYRRQPSGLLSHFDSKVRYCVLRLRVKHPRWGPNRILAKLQKRRTLKGLPLPSEASIGRYLHQWEHFRRHSKVQKVRERPRQPTEVYDLWQMDFKVDITLQDSTHLHLHTVCDPVGEVCIGARVFAVQKVQTRTKRVDFRSVRAMLRRCFDQWGALPAAIQTDGESTLVSHVEDPFPSDFDLWLAGLGIQHFVTRSGKPTDNAEVERFHRTFNDYAIIGNEKLSVDELQAILDEAVIDHAFELSSRAEGCAGRPPLEAHPELLEPPQPYRAEHELAIFDLKRVDAFLSSFTWTRKVGKTGQICIGGQHKYYSVGRAYARQHVLVRFDPSDRHFVFYLPTSDEYDAPQEIGRRPARYLELEDITGLATWPADLLPQQLPLPFIFCEGVIC